MGLKASAVRRSHAVVTVADGLHGDRFVVDAGAFFCMVRPERIWLGFGVHFYGTQAPLLLGAKLV